MTNILTGMQFTFGVALGILILWLIGCVMDTIHSYIIRKKDRKWRKENLNGDRK